jgi:hypothetical protein
VEKYVSSPYWNHLLVIMRLAFVILYVCEVSAFSEGVDCTVNTSWIELIVIRSNVCSGKWTAKQTCYCSWFNVQVSVLHLNKWSVHFLVRVMASSLGWCQHEDPTTKCKYNLSVNVRQATQGAGVDIPSFFWGGGCWFVWPYFTLTVKLKLTF